MVSERVFEENVKKINTLEINKSDKYYLDGLYNQVVYGDNTTDSSIITDPDELGIWNEWNKNIGMKKDIAMNKYCDYVKTINNLIEKNIYKK